jgi:microsomal dipeptidase-like Zn-dependent dipeptidase
MKGASRLAAHLAIAASAMLGSQAHAAVEGFVDMHSHLMAEHAFGGSWFWGTVEGPIETALARCDGNFIHAPANGSHGATIFPLVTEILGKDTGWHKGRRNGYDNRQCEYKNNGQPKLGTCPEEHLEHWPRWDAIAHQQMWHAQLRQAHQNGLRIMAVSMFDSEFLCKITPPLRRRYACNEMDSVKRQIKLLRDFAQNHSDWVGIAETPGEARALIAQGKLALVMTVEVTKLFPTGDYITQLKEWQGLGVRSLQMVHHANNRFAGAAPINSLRTAGTLVEALSGQVISTDINNISCHNAAGEIEQEKTPYISGAKRPKCDGRTYLNPNGLTHEGKQLAEAMIDLGMILDVSHLSRRSFKDLYQIAVEKGNYPLTYSHTHMWSTIRVEDDKKEKYDKHEKYLLDSESHMIANTKGMIGLRTGPEWTHTYIKPGSSAPLVANTCQGTARSFAQSLMHAMDSGLDVGFGADLNGFIEQIRSVEEKDCPQEFKQLTAANQYHDLHRKGFAHVGHFLGLINDLKRVGVPTSYMERLEKHSAEKYLQVWERGLTLAGINHIESGGKNNKNLALGAVSKASNTLCDSQSQQNLGECHTVHRVNDGHADTAPGVLTGWASNTSAKSPWVELEWQMSVKFSRVKLYTTSGVPIRNYRVQYWDGNGWQLLTDVVNNTLVSNTHVYPAWITTKRLRVTDLKGPIGSPMLLRINEIEVY